ISIQDSEADEMSEDTFRLFPLGDSALTADLGNEISERLNGKAIALSNYLESHPFPGFIESFPAYSSITVCYDLLVVRRNFLGFLSAFEAVKHWVENASVAIKVSRSKKTRTVEIPVIFDRETGPDLEFIARHCGLETDEVVNIFSSTTYRVYMLGFLPGFSY